MKTTVRQKSIGKGRPKAQTGENKRERILDSALFLFAKHGVSETTVAQIAEKSGVTSAMVHYYFKNWDGLLDTIMAERIAPKVAYVWNGMEKISSVPEIVTIFVDRFFTIMEEEPLFPELWNREIFNVGGNFRERFIHYYPLEKLQAVQQIFIHAQEEGQINPQLQTSHILISAIGLIIFPLIAHDLLSPLLKLPEMDKEKYKQHVLTLLADGLYALKGNQQ